MGAPAIVFAFQEDGLLCVYGSTGEAIREYEGIDVESGTVSFYDRQGTFLRPAFSVLNRRGKLLGFVSWVRSGTYDLVADPKADADSFSLALFEARALDPNVWFSSLAELKATLVSEGVAAELGIKVKA